MSGKSAFSEDQINDFQETFNLFDTKGDGKIPVSYFPHINFKLHVYNYEEISCSKETTPRLSASILILYRLIKWVRSFVPLVKTLLRLKSTV